MVSRLFSNVISSAVTQGLIESPYTYLTLIPTIGGAWIASVESSILFLLGALLSLVQQFSVLSK